ncbi:MAG TPA: glycosyltransferase family 4 protein [Ohtaekwangia sp.]|uniref:glycosyltransferase family 4 protein n=1 Tax=Ohtaekwangia sp. TaxID=2066019 RepID=UPI002F92EC2C
MAESGFIMLAEQIKSNSSVKVLHIIAGDIKGGAARGALWLHQGLLDMHVESRILTNSKETLANHTISSVAQTTRDLISNAIRARADQLPVMLYRNRKTEIFSTAIVGYNFLKHPLFEWADIIHLHWINGGFVNIRHLAKIKKPIVWTLRDMWPLTGGCHIALDCTKYQTGCGACPQLASTNQNDLSKYTLYRKKKYIPKKTALVGISQWISDCARQSSLFSDFNILTISNNINCNDFFPIEKNTARKLLGLPTNEKILLVGAQKINDHSKGFDKFIEAMNYLKEPPFLLFFGKIDSTFFETTKFKGKSLGFLSDTISLRIVYSAADVFVAPTLMDSFGKTLAEAMACGTPVVCFDATGPKDIVDHKINGYKAKPFSTMDLAEGIKWVLSNGGDDLSGKARKKAVENFDSSIIAAKYQKLYIQLLEQTAS